MRRMSHHYLRQFNMARTTTKLQVWTSWYWNNLGSQLGLNMKITRGSGTPESWHIMAIWQANTYKYHPQTMDQLPDNSPMECWNLLPAVLPRTSTDSSPPRQRDPAQDDRRARRASWFQHVSPWRSTGERWRKDRWCQNMRSCMERRGHG